MDCTALSYDNRETCSLLVPSSCVPYTGYIATSLVPLLPPCKPNINDVLKALQDLLDTTRAKLGNNTTLNKECFTFNPALATQKDINQEMITKICALITAVNALGGPVDPTTIQVAIDLLCLETPGCTVPATYTLQEILEKLVTAYCNLLTRVTNIETILNI